jgi:hypothetical protein
VFAKMRETEGKNNAKNCLETIDSDYGKYKLREIDCLEFVRGAR